MSHKSNHETIRSPLEILPLPRGSLNKIVHARGKSRDNVNGFVTGVGVDVSIRKKKELKNILPVPKGVYNTRRILKKSMTIGLVVMIWFLFGHGKPGPYVRLFITFSLNS